MVTIKQLDPKYPRLGYEIKKGLVIDLPRGDGNASIANDNGSLYLSEGSCVVKVNPDTIQMADDATLTVKMHRHEEDNRLTLSDLTVNGDTMIHCSGGDNVVTNDILSGHNNIDMDVNGNSICDSHIVHSDLNDTSVKNSHIDYGRLFDTRVSDSQVKNSYTFASHIGDDSIVELSSLGFDKVHGAKLGGVTCEPDPFSLKDRIFENGYYIGCPENGYDPIQVADEKAYIDGLAILSVHGDIPYEIRSGDYQPSDDLKEAIKEKWETLSDFSKTHTDELYEWVPYVKDVVEDDFVIDESQFEINPQQSLQR
jgi:hypothetical protein